MYKPAEIAVALIRKNADTTRLTTRTVFREAKVSPDLFSNTYLGAGPRLSRSARIMLVFLFSAAVFAGRISSIPYANAAGTSSKGCDGKFLTTFTERNRFGFHLRFDRPGLHHGLRDSAPD